jgi:hypothetical protein
MCVGVVEGTVRGRVERSVRTGERTRISPLYDYPMAGASAADVRSILSLPSPSTQPQQQPKKAPAPLARKPSGISRELYSLIGPSAPTLVAQVAKPRLKQKPNLGSGGSTKWYVLSSRFTLHNPEMLCRVWKSFKNSARTDGLELGHWVKANTDPDAGLSSSLAHSLLECQDKSQNIHLQGTTPSPRTTRTLRMSTPNS